MAKAAPDGQKGDSERVSLTLLAVGFQARRSVSEFGSYVFVFL